MKNYTSIIFFALFLFSSQFLTAQTQEDARFKAEIYTGINIFVAFSDDETVTFPSSSSITNITTPLKGIAIGSALSYKLSSRFSAMIDLSYMNAKKTDSKNFITSNIAFPILTLENKREFSAMGVDLLILYSLLQNDKINFQLGAGVYLFHRKHYYKSELDATFNEFDEIQIVANKYSTSIKTNIGIPLFASLSYLVNENWSVGLRAKLIMPNFDQDLNQNIALSLGYHF